MKVLAAPVVAFSYAAQALQSAVQDFNRNAQFAEVPVVSDGLVMLH